MAKLSDIIGAWHAPTPSVQPDISSLQLQQLTAKLRARRARAGTNQEYDIDHDIDHEVDDEAGTVVPSTTDDDTITPADLQAVVNYGAGNHLDVHLVPVSEREGKPGVYGSKMGGSDNEKSHAPQPPSKLIPPKMPPPTTTTKAVVNRPPSVKQYHPPAQKSKKSKKPPKKLADSDTLANQSSDTIIAKQTSLSDLFKQL